MIIFTVLGLCAASFFLLVILMTIIESRSKKRTEKLLWKMDKVETRVGGLAHDRIYEVEKEDIVMDEMENNER